MTVPFRAATPARLASVAVVIGMLLTLLLQSAMAPSAARAMGTLPACRYDDILTSPRAYDDWSTTLVDTILRVTKTYVPPDLIPVSQAGLSGTATIRAITIDDLRAMAAAAAAAKAPLAVDSAYRSYTEQKIVFDGWVTRLGYARALQVSARPGHSEHQLGLAMDFKSKGGGSPFDGDWGTTAAGLWMGAHAWEYGFVMSYPKGAIKRTCYDYEPWHFRYVGKDLAALIHASGVTPREYLWSHFTTTVVPPPNPTAHPSAPPTKAPAPSPTASPALPTAAPPSPSPTATPELPTPSPIPVPSTPTGPSALPSPPAVPLPVDPTVAAGALPMLVVVAAIAFTAIIGGAWLASRRRRPGVGRPG